ncbi:MAG: putative transporter [Duodenibacillus sp.]|nr:putative transporter [Duodenibacillus sp.]
MDWITNLFTNPDSIGHILLVYSAVIALGMAFGHVKVKGISLGVTFVLFAGLAANYFGVTVNPTILGFLRDFGLILFVFFIGLQVGPSFFSSFKSEGVTLNLLTAAVAALGIAVTIVLFFACNGAFTLPQMLGVHFGAVTNTPGLGATQEALGLMGYKGEDIAVGYACAYPLGVVSLILSAVALRMIFKIDLKDEDRHWEELEQAHSAAPIWFEAEITNHAVGGVTIAHLRQLIHRPFICSRILHEGVVRSPMPEDQVYVGDVVRIVCDAEHKESILRFCGKASTKPEIDIEHSPVTSRKLVLTEPGMNGCTIRDLHLSRLDGVNITRVFRAGVQLFPARSLRLQLGDRLFCVGPERSVERLAARVGNQAAKLDHPNVIAIFVGIGLGILLGSIPLAIPGMPAPLKLGLAGGPLIVGILLGHFGPSLRLVTYTTLSANLMLRELGIALFLASVGLAAGDKFVNALVQGNGPWYVLLGLVITTVPVMAAGVYARAKLKLNYHTIIGMLAGATTNPPLLAYAGTVSEKNSPIIAYSTVYPLAMFLRILSGQLVLLAMYAFI